jgi:glycosyltransferase involved in cell wall biosynthesis
VKVSFVIPTRNQAPFLRRCLDSCLAQKIDDREVWVLDGLSSDGTQEILASYGERIRWLSEKDNGQGDAVNKGVAKCSGEIIAWINSDDYYPSPEVLPRVLAEFGENDIVYGDGMMVDVNGAPIRPYRARPLLSARELIVNPSSPLSQPAVFFRRSLFLDVGGLDPALHLTLDYDLFIRMWSRALRTKYIPETFAHATYHVDAKSIRSMGKQIREATWLKLRHARSVGLGARDWTRLGAGLGQVYLYWVVTRTGLYRTT